MAENKENRNQENPNQQQENNERQYICNACKEQPTGDLSKALSHSFLHKKNYSFACGKCGWVYKEYKIYESHFLGEHVAKHHQNHGKKQQPKADPPIAFQEEQMIVDAIHQKRSCGFPCIMFFVEDKMRILRLIFNLRTVQRQMIFPSCLVLAPTRELTRQAQIEFEDTAPNLSTFCLYGGMPIMNQVRQLEYGVDIDVGTPGRIIDFVERGSLILSEVKFVVLDEADQMLAIGFQEDVECFLKYVPKQRQCMLFSATMPSWVTQLSRKYFKNPLTIDLVGDSEQKLADGITLYSIATSSSWKESILPTLISVATTYVLDVIDVAHVINLDLPKL